MVIYVTINLCGNYPEFTIYPEENGGSNLQPSLIPPRAAPV